MQPEPGEAATSFSDDDDPITASSHPPQNVPLNIMQPEEAAVSGYIRNDLNRFAKMVWGNPQAISKPHESGGFEYIHLEGYLEGFRALFGSVVEEKILVRDEYRIAIQELQKPKYCRGAYVTGQPGIGKSLFLVYLLVQFLGQQRKVAVHDPDHRFYAVFTNTVAFYPLSETTPLAKGGLMYALSDSSRIEAPPPSFSLFDAMQLIQATSPKKSRWHEWSKQAKAKCYVMDIWTEQEIANLANLKDYNGQRMVDLWKKWGGAPRTLLMYLKKSDQEIEDWYHGRAREAIGKCQNMVQSIVSQKLPEGSDVPSRFYFCRPAYFATSSINRTQTCATVPTHTICNILGKALQQLSNAIKLEFFTALSQFNDTRQAAGFIYQAWFNCFISTANKSIDCHWFDEQDKVTKLYGTTNLASESAKELNARKEFPYYWPASTVYPGIDGALICDTAIFAFQITLSSIHTSPEPGVRKLRAQLPANLRKLPWYVVFVGTMEDQSKAVAQQWVRKVFLMKTSKTPVPILWSTVDPVAEDVNYRIIRDEDESMDVNE